MSLETKAMEVAARAIHENYYGKATWKAATPAERGHARQAVRVMLSALDKVGVTVAGQGQKPSANGARPATASARPAPPRPLAQRSR